MGSWLLGPRWWACFFWMTCRMRIGETVANKIENLMVLIAYARAGCVSGVFIIYLHTLFMQVPPGGWVEAEALNLNLITQELLKPKANIETHLPKTAPSYEDFCGFHMVPFQILPWLGSSAAARSKMPSWSACFFVAFHVAPAVGETQVNDVRWEEWIDRSRFVQFFLVNDNRITLGINCLSRILSNNSFADMIYWPLYTLFCWCAIGYHILRCSTGWFQSWCIYVEVVKG